MTVTGTGTSFVTTTGTFSLTILVTLYGTGTGTFSTELIVFSVDCFITGTPPAVERVVTGLEVVTDVTPLAKDPVYLTVVVLPLDVV